MGMPVLAAFLADRGEQLQDLAVDVITRLGAMRALAETLVRNPEALLRGKQGAR